ncbi:MAG: class I SAM-dependent methyltransferase [Promethearchaeota archaeon]
MDAFYGGKATEYSQSRWMKRIQVKTTLRALELIGDARVGGEIPWNTRPFDLTLDLGCGNGFSTLTIFHAGFSSIVGIDISLDMLKRSEYDFPVIQADMVHLPFRENQFKYLVSISAMNFISQEIQEHGKSSRIYEELVSELKYTLYDRGCRGVIEFYPKENGELALIMNKFGTSASGLTSFLVIDKPGTRKEQKYILFTRD